MAEVQQDSLQQVSPMGRIGPLAIAGDGILAGGFGASAIALYFLAVDVLARQALFTPSLVGAAILGRDTGGQVDLFLVAVYTAIHGVLFIGFATVCAWVLARLPRTPDLPLIALAIYVALEGGFVVFARLALPGLAETIGHGHIAVGNILAAVAMALYLRVVQPHPEDFAAGDA